MNKFIISSILVLFFAAVILPATEREPSPIEKEIRRIRSVKYPANIHRKSQVETNLLALLKTAQRPEDKGKIYVELVHTIFSSGFDRFYPKGVQDNKMLNYSSEALKLPLGTIDACLIYNAKSDAIMSKYRELGSTNRVEMVIPVLQGLKFVLDHIKNTTSRQKPPERPTYSYLGTLSADKIAEIDRKEKEYEDWWEAAGLQYHLLSYKETFIERIVEVYCYKTPPDTTGELDKLAHSILGNHPIISEMISKIKQRRAELGVVLEP